MMQLNLKDNIQAHVLKYNSKMKDSHSISCIYDINGSIFDTNNTRHASRWISAPRRVFDFYKGALS